MDSLIDLIVLLVKYLAKRRREAAARASSVRAGPASRSAPAAKPPQRQAAPRSTLGSVKVERALLTILEAAEKEAETCAAEEANERFVDTLLRSIAGPARSVLSSLRNNSAGAIPQAERAVEALAFLLRVTSELAAQRRNPEKLLLLGDADALAEACYRPLVEHARGNGIRLLSSRAATFLGEKELAIFTSFIPTGLAPIMLPSAWATEIGWWPALAHEIGHDFHASVVGLDAELHFRSGLPHGGQLPAAEALVGPADVRAAYGAWLPELFADLFGTLMLGAAYVTTMVWAFADSKNIPRVLAALPKDPNAWQTYDEHPPAHLRVVLACRQLATMGFPGEARVLEDEWRHRHGMPDALLLPTRDKAVLHVAEEPYVAFGAALTAYIYQTGFETLAGFSLRSMPGLDLGPREHQAAVEVRDVFLDGRTASTSDPRCLIAGAVLAWKDRPALSARVLRAARATIPAVGVSREQLRLRVARDAESAGGATTPVNDAALWRHAFLLGEALAPPSWSKLQRRL